jgi:ankyrin repeat protein
VTACGIAAYKGNLQILDMLYRGGADINITAKNGIGPLYLAIKSNKIDCAKYLIERKATCHFSDPMR